MKDKNIFILLLFSFLISFSQCFMFRLVDDYEKYCYKKYIDKGDQITANYIVASDKEELITVDLSYQKQGQQNKPFLWNNIKMIRGYNDICLSRYFGSRIAILPRISNAEPTLCPYTKKMYITHQWTLALALSCSRITNLRDSKSRR